jgi:hypothetical protein
MATTATDPTATAARLCFKCSVLEFDDCKIGVERLVRNKKAREDGLIYDYDMAKGPWEVKIDLDYFHVDVLPGLDELSRSAEAGCDFCRYLREAIRKSNPRGDWEGRIHIKLAYYWRHAEAPQIGLNALVAVLQIEKTQSDREGSWGDGMYPEDGAYLWHRPISVVFRVESGKGKQIRTPKSGH